MAFLSSGASWRGNLLEGDSRATKRREYLPEVFHVLPRRLLEDDDVVEVHEATLPFDPPEDHVDGPLEVR